MLYYLFDYLDTAFDFPGVRNVSVYFVPRGYGCDSLIADFAGFWQKPHQSFEKKTSRRKHSETGPGRRKQ